MIVEVFGDWGRLHGNASVDSTAFVVSCDLAGRWILVQTGDVKHWFSEENYEDIVSLPHIQPPRAALESTISSETIDIASTAEEILTEFKPTLTFQSLPNCSAWPARKLPELTSEQVFLFHLFVYISCQFSRMSMYSRFLIYMVDIPTQLPPHNV